MKLGVGRIIHVLEPATNTCVAAIVTSAPNPEGKSTVTLFPPNGAIGSPSSRSAVWQAGRGNWHDPRECPNDA